MNHAEKYIPTADELAESLFPEQIAQVSVDPIPERPVDLDGFFRTVFANPLAL